MRLLSHSTQEDESSIHSSTIRIAVRVRRIVKGAVVQHWTCLFNVSLTIYLESSVDLLEDPLKNHVQHCTGSKLRWFSG